MKRSPSPHLSPSTPSPSQKKPKATPKTPSSKSPKKGSTTPGAAGNPNPKAQYAQMIFDAGIRALSKGEVEEATGISANAQRDLTRGDKGSLRKAFNAFCEGLV